MPPMVGQITLLPYNFAPAGWMFCDGALLPISESELLFTLLGTAYGGDGESTFGVPNLSASAPTDCHYCISLFGVYPENFYEALIGETLSLPTSYPLPQNLLECAGQSLSKNQYPLLATFIGNRFGGDGNNFNLPDLTSKPLVTGYHYLIGTQGNNPSVPGNRDPFIGELLFLPYNQAFQSLQVCDGSRLPVQQNTALYALIGNKFGGDTQQFAVPDLRAAVPPNYNYYISLTGIFPQRP